MHGKLEQLANLALRPSRLAVQIRGALLPGQMPAPPDRARSALSAAALPADGLAILAGSLCQLGVSWLACFVVVRLAVPTWDLPPGPWRNRRLLPGFDPDSLMEASGLLVALIVVPITLCRVVGTVVHRMLGGNTLFALALEACVALSVRLPSRRAKASTTKNVTKTVVAARTGGCCALPRGVGVHPAGNHHA